MKKEKLIFIYPNFFTFIKTEEEILTDEFELITQDLNWPNKLLLPFNLFLQFFFLLLNINKVNRILISFGGYWSLLPSLFGRLFRKKVAIVVHGTDCVSFQEINYGNLRIPLMRWFTKKSYQFCDIILPVSDSLVYTENKYYSDTIIKFGYQHHLSGISTPYKVIPNGLILDDWKVENTVKMPYTFITVMTDNQFVRKGGDLIVEAAKRFPDLKFYFAGIDKIGKLDIPENVICLGHLTPQELKEYYSKTQFYLQLSNFEGFGVAICEAMLCNCVPIVADVNFLPNIVEDSGFVLKKRNLGMLSDLIQVALQSDIENLAIKAKRRIETEFHVGIRKKILISVLERLK
jgi:glycosyltransferase involved in cell wall biosynthesis